MSWQVTVAEFDRWEEKIRRLNRRAAKRGFTGQVHLSGERAVVVNDGRFAHLPRGVEVVVVNAEITGEPPCYGSWRFLAALDALPAEDGGIGWVIRYAPGAEERGIDRTVLRARWCDHCRTERVNRRHLYAVEHLETGEIMQVGSTCIKDFLGHSTGPVVLSTTEVEEQLERFGGWRDAFTPRTVVAAALATVGVAGWVSRTLARDTHRPATADLVEDYLQGAGESARRARTLLDPLMPAALEQATVVIEAVLTGYATETGEYAANLRAALRAESVGARQLGLVCSTVSAHQRLQAQTANPEPEWEWLGSVGEKVTITGTVRAALRLPGYTHYSRDQVLLVITSGTTLAKTITSAAWAYDVRAGDQITVTATVKALQTYRGDRQTVLRAPRIPRTTATTAKKEH